MSIKKQFDTLWSLCWPLAIVNPRQARDFAHLAKTDRIDALAELACALTAIPIGRSL